jgi:hypothetical protein
MKVLFAIVVADLISTLVMTAFSAVMAKIAQSDYIEPHLLNRFLAPRFKNAPMKHSSIGWIIHFSVGLLFIFVYHVLWANQFMTGSVTHAALLGFVSGIVGAVGWRIVRHFAADLQELWHSKYYVQLILAHVVFALVASKVYFATA